MVRINGRQRLKRDNLHRFRRVRYRSGRLKRQVIIKNLIVAFTVVPDFVIR
ncbi:hypothetical protein D3C80_2198880 [compost metagenome]